VGKPASGVPGMSEADLRALHERYSELRKQTGEPGQVKYETLVASITRQVPRVLAKPGVNAVRFDVVVEGGKAVLRAIPKK
jgi:hypothetical protein